MEISTEERIKKAAEEVFMLQGLEGARMQDIADKAGINKAMLHYYFKNKKVLFDLVLNEKLQKVFMAFSVWLDPTLNIEQKLKSFVEREITILSEFPSLPLFVLMEVRKNPDTLKSNNLPLEAMRSSFEKMLDKEVKLGNIRPTSMQELLLNTVSLCIYPIVAAPVLQQILGIEEKEYWKLIEERKTSVAKMLINEFKIKQ